MFLSVRKRHEAMQHVILWRLSGSKPERIIDRMGGGPALAFSPDDRYFAMVNDQKTIEIYDLASGECRWQLPARQPVQNLVFAPHKTRLAIGTNRGVQVRDFQTGKLVGGVLEPNVGFGTLAWHPDGDVLAGISNDDWTIFLWDIAAGKLLGKLQGIRGGGNNLAFNHAGDLLASNGWEGLLRLWDWRGRRQLFATHCEYLSCPRFSADDRRLAADRLGNRLRLWVVAGGGEYRTLSRDPPPGPANDQVGLVSLLSRFDSKSSGAAGPAKYEHGVAIDPTGRLLAAPLKDGVCFWDLKSGQQARFVPFRQRTESLVFEGSGALLTFGDTGLLRWPLKQPAAGEATVYLGPIQKLPMPGAQNPMAASADARRNRLRAWPGPGDRVAARSIARNRISPSQRRLPPTRRQSRRTLGRAGRLRRKHAGDRGLGCPYWTDREGAAGGRGMFGGLQSRRKMAGDRSGGGGLAFLVGRLLVRAAPDCGFGFLAVAGSPLPGVFPG